jgi:hypothetical protein
LNKPVAQALGLALLMIITGVTGAGLARAQTVADLYSAEVPVANQSSAELQKGARAALADVLVKVSGSSGLLANPAIKSALAKARSQVIKYGYSQDQRIPGKLLMRFEFDRTYVTDLIIEAGAPLWTANRPTVLVWLVVEDAEGRRFATPDSDPELIADLRAAFSRRGVPMQLPMYDLADAAALTPDAAWRLDRTALLAASARYDVQDILAGRIAIPAAGDLSGEWMYLRDGNVRERPVKGADTGPLLREGVAMVAEDMASRYAVAPTAGGGGLAMSVSGVTGYADYAAVVSWLESIELIEHANIERVQGDVIQLRLHAKVDAAQLAGILELNEQLVPLPGVTTDGVELAYQWLN